MIKNKELLVDCLGYYLAALKNEDFSKIQDKSERNHWINQRNLFRNYFLNQNCDILDKSFFSLTELYFYFSALNESRNFLIKDDIKEILLNTDIEIKMINLPFPQVFIDCNINLDNNYYIPGLLLVDTKQLINIKELEDENFLILFCIKNHLNNKFSLYTFFADEEDILTNKNLALEEKISTEPSEFYLNVDFRKKIAFFCLSFLKMLYNPDIEICYKEYSDIRIKRKEAQNKEVENYYYLKIRGKLREYIDVLNLECFKKEYLKHTQSWVVRGFYKKLTSNFYKNKRGQEVFVPPFVKGIGNPISKEYVVSNKIIWKNQMLMIEYIKNIFKDEIVLINTRGILNGLELDCYIPRLKLAFEYNGKQHYEYVSIFHNSLDSLEEVKKRDRLKKKLCDNINIKLIIIDYNELLSEELIINKINNINSLQIINIEEVNNINMCDVQVEETHNFFIYNGLLLKNSGKTWKGITINQGLHSAGFKITDYFGGKRSENTFWCFPSDEVKLWREFENNVGVMKEKGPKEYKVNLLYPIFSTKLPKKLPNLEPRIKCKCFTIPLKTITLLHVSLVIGDLSNKSKMIFNKIMNNIDKNSTGADVEYLFKTKLKKYVDSPLYTLFFKPLIENNLLGSNFDDYHIDLEDEANDKEVVSVLCQDFLPKEFQYFIMGYFLTTTMDLVNHDKISKKNIAYFREASLFMKVQDKTTENEEVTQIFRNLITDIARYARSGLFLVMESQSSSEVKNMIEGSDDLQIICELPGQRDREELCVPLKKDLRINSLQIRYIATMPIHEMVIVERGKKARLLKRVMPPRSMCWKQGHGNFYSLWKNKYDTYKNIDSIIDKLQDEYKNRLKNLEEEHNKKIKEKITSIEEVRNKNKEEVEEKPEKTQEIIKEEKEIGLLDNSEYEDVEDIKELKPIIEEDELTIEAKKIKAKEEKRRKIEKRIKELEELERQAIEDLNKPIVC